MSELSSFWPCPIYSLLIKISSLSENCSDNFQLFKLVQDVHNHVQLLGAAFLFHEPIVIILELFYLFFILLIQFAIILIGSKGDKLFDRLRRKLHLSSLALQTLALLTLLICCSLSSGTHKSFFSSFHPVPVIA